MDEPAPGKTLQKMAPKKLSGRHKLIAYMIAQGMKQREVARELNMTEGRLSIIANCERFKQQVKHLQWEMYGTGAKERFNKILPRAIETAEEIMENPQEKSAVRMDAVKVFLDRALGKPKTEVTVGGSLIEQLFQKLDNLDDEKPMKDIEDAEYSELSDKEEEKKPEKEYGIDSWAEDNL